MSEWISHAQWPSPAVQLGNIDNVSTDSHGSQEEAQAICHALEKRGFGGDGKIFPIRTWWSKAPEKENDGQV